MSGRRPPSWAWVTTLTVGALAAVTVLAVQANDGPRPVEPVARTKPTTTPSPLASIAPSEPPEHAIPTASGVGRRIVYSLGERRVWLVDPNNNYDDSYAVWPGTISPETGPYQVSFKRAEGAGSDGVAIENIVYFTVKDGVSIAFSNALDGASPAPSPGLNTGAIRMDTDAGDAIWTFGTEGTKVVVVD
ncbi:MULTISPECIES: hypothetical protein [unclassified Streptomyces]|uniref:hypothetical protein n=1 Tax=unclassified Streptomyces TaxID=2593676 RepID=UPI0037F52B42